MISRSEAHNLLPDILVIGQQRCGTSALHQYLSIHPEFSLPRPKETHFFSRRYHYGFRWYQRCFSKNRSGIVKVEFCPSYLTSLSALRRIYHLSSCHGKIPHIIVIKRNTSDQQSSLLSYRYMRGQISDPTVASCLKKNLYAEELCSDDMIYIWMKYFPSLKVIDYHKSTLFDDFVSHLNKLGCLQSPITLQTDYVEVTNQAVKLHPLFKFLRKFIFIKESIIRISPGSFYS